MKTLANTLYIGLLIIAPVGVYFFMNAVSFVFFVYGNEGWEVVNDYGVSLEAAMAPINKWCEALE